MASNPMATSLNSRPTTSDESCASRGLPLLRQFIEHRIAVVSTLPVLPGHVWLQPQRLVESHVAHFAV
jgi:hypothetical protein